MNYAEFSEWVVFGETEVRFASGIEKTHEGYFDEGMKAIVSTINEGDDGEAEIVFHCEKYDKHNELVEKCNYYDKDGRAVWSARQAGQHPERCNWRESVFVFRADQEMPFVIIPRG